MNNEQEKHTSLWLASGNKELRNQGLSRITQLSYEGILGHLLSPPLDISTGISSAVFDVNTSDGRKIIKFRERGVLAEAFAYAQWAKENVPVPTVSMTSQADHDHNYEFIVMDPVTNKSGSLAPTAVTFAQDDRDTIERFFGENLAKIHKIKGDHFGNILAQQPGIQFPTWNKYLEHEIEILIPFLEQKSGLSTQQLSSIEKVTSVEYSENPVCAHGDIGIHNVLVTEVHPFQGVIIDPNPLFADPYYDLAYYLNLKEAWTGNKINPEDDTFLKAYFLKKADVVDIKRLTAQRVFTAIHRILSTTKRGEIARTRKYQEILIEQLAILRQ